MFSKRLDRINPSATLEMTAKAAELKQADPFPDIQIAKTPIRKIHLVKDMGISMMRPLGER